MYLLNHSKLILADVCVQCSMFENVDKITEDMSKADAIISIMHATVVMQISQSCRHSLSSAPRGAFDLSYIS